MCVWGGGQGTRKQLFAHLQPEAGTEEDCSVAHSLLSSSLRPEHEIAVPTLGLGFPISNYHV